MPQYDTDGRKTELGFQELDTVCLSVCLHACSSSNTFGQMKWIQFLRTNDDNRLPSANEHSRDPTGMLQGLSGYTRELSLDEFKLL
jgi:hypothetical protein